MAARSSAHRTRRTPKTASKKARSKNIDEIKRRNVTANLQWAAIAAAVLLLVIAIFVFGWGTGDGLVQHSG